ncbi:ACP S-malonyltransferase [Buchnera aphidicola]|uniref:ACP S-malonyltransferase n=1 Tax=Buchnera aphidicola TaxID=9 RepID=UPI0031B88B36
MLKFKKNDSIKKMNLFAMIFPGQGIQKKNMLNELSLQDTIVKNTFNESSSAVGYNLWKLIKNDTNNQLNYSEFIQPAILTTSVAIYRLWIDKHGYFPDIMAGNSLGEYSALVCANAISLYDSAKLVQFRGKLMQKIIRYKQVAMSAIIGLDKKKVIDICNQQKKNQIVDPSNFNTLNQTVISGNKSAVERVGIDCKKSGATHVIPLNINIAAHCRLMIPAANKLSRFIKKIHFNKPTCPVINNIDVKCEFSKKKICKALVKQLSYPVRWYEIIDFIKLQGIKLILEVGSSSILTKLNINNISITSIALNNSSNFLTAFHRIKTT